MADAKVNIVGNSEDAQRAVDKLRASFEKLEEKLRNQAKFSRQAKTSGDEYLKSMTVSAASLVTSIVSVQTAWAMATKAVTAYMEANQRVQDLRDAAAPNARETEIKIINQGQLNKDEAATTMENINLQAKMVSVSDVTDAKRITEEAFSQGFERQEVINGEVLRAFLELKAATNQYGAGATDSKELVKSLATSLRNTEGRDPGQMMTAQEIEDFGKSFQALTLTGSIQLADAIPFARIQAILTARGIDNATQLAAFSEAVDVFGSGDVAATYLQQATAYMGRAGSEKMQKKFDKLGIEIDGTQFDLIGEDFVGALKNMNAALEGMDPRQKADAIDALFGTKAAAGAITLMSRADNIEKGRQKMAGAAGGGAYFGAVENFMLSDFSEQQKKVNAAEIKAWEGLKAGGNLTQGDVDKLIDTTRENMKADHNAKMFDFAATGFIADTIFKLSGKSQTPKERLETLQLLQHDNPANMKILSETMDEFDPRTRQMEVLGERLKRESTDAAEAGAAAVQFPEKMQVNDPDLQASVNTLNDTMKDMLSLMSSGPDRQRVVKLPVRTSANA